MNNTIAGKSIISCAECGCGVREDLLTQHSAHCQARHKPAVSVPIVYSRHSGENSRKSIMPTKAQKKRAARTPSRIACPNCGLVVPDVHLVAHRARCEAPPVPHKIISAEEKMTSVTHDGYQISLCWSCGRRVCLMPKDPSNQIVYDIVRGRAGEIHLCDDATSGDRRSKLVYVDPEVGSIAPRRDKGKLRKL